MKALEIEIPDDLADELDEIITKEELDLSEVVEEALQEWIDGNYPDDEEE